MKLSFFVALFSLGLAMAAPAAELLMPEDTSVIVGRASCSCVNGVTRCCTNNVCNSNPNARCSKSASITNGRP